MLDDKVKRINLFRINKSSKTFWFYKQAKGSHELWVRDLDNIVIPVPHHRGKTIRKGTIRAIIREINVTVEEFMDSQ